MRVSLPGRLRSTDGQRGAVAVLTAVLLVVLIGAAALAVDYGNGLQTRRQLITATDAAALAAARVEAAGGSGCAVTAGYVTENLPGATSTCEVTAERTVIVRAERDVEFVFAPVTAALLGLDAGSASGTTVSSLSAVSWDEAGSVSGGLRPFGLCHNNEAYRDWIAQSPPRADSAPIRIPIDNDGSGCGESPGSFGWIDFDTTSGSSGTPVIREWLLDGYDGEVDHDQVLPSRTGMIAAVKRELQTLVDTAEAFPIPLLAELDGGQYRLAGFIGVQVVDFNLTGSDDNWIEVILVDIDVSGTGDGPPGTSAQVPRMCAVTEDGLFECGPGGP